MKQMNPNPIRNVYVADEEGRVYRIALYGARPLIVIQRRDGHDHGRALDTNGAKARRLIRKARVPGKAIAEPGAAVL